MIDKAWSLEQKVRILEEKNAKLESDALFSRICNGIIAFLAVALLIYIYIASR